MTLPDRRMQLVSPVHAALTGLLIGAGPAFAGAIATTHNKPVRVRQYVAWHSDCTGNGLPLVSIAKQPRHGALQIRPEPVNVRNPRAHCDGSTLDGIGLYYVPAAGFHGADAFTYLVQYPSGRSDTQTYTVGVY